MTGNLRDLGGRDVWVDDRGTGGVLLFVHGLGGTSAVFDGQVAALSDGNRTIRFDLAGHGQSPLGEETSIESWASDIVAILDAYEVPTAVIVAHSLGTLVAQQVAATHPERVDALVLLGPIRELAPAGRQAQHDRAALVRADGMAAVAGPISRAATSALTQSERPEVTAAVEQLLAGQDPHGYAAACKALAASAAPDVSEFTGASLLITGSADGVSPADRLEEHATAFTAAQTVVIDGIGHWTSLEAPDEVSRLIIEFLSE